MCFVLLIASPCFAGFSGSTPITHTAPSNTETVMNDVWDDDANALNVSTGVARGTTTLVRGTLFRPDGGIPSSAVSADAVDMTGFKTALVSISCDTSAQGWKITPLFGDSISNKYIPGSTTTVSGDTALFIIVNGEDDFYIQAEGATGTPAMSIIVTGVK